MHFYLKHLTGNTGLINIQIIEQRKMKKGLIFFLAVLLLQACSKENINDKQYEPGNELVGSWVNLGTNYAGSQIIGSTTLIFKSDKTFVALDKAKGMPTLTESGSWLVKSDTLKMKFKKSIKSRPDLITYDERNGGSKDLFKPAPADSDGYIAWNYKMAGNKIVISNSGYGYTGPGELVKE